MPHHSADLRGDQVLKDLSSLLCAECALALSALVVDLSHLDDASGDRSAQSTRR